MSATADPLRTKRRNRPTIGVMLTTYYCNGCVSSDDEKRASAVDELRDGDDAGKPIRCAKCGRELKPDEPR